jgi:hypothetical protein
MLTRSCAIAILGACWLAGTAAAETDSAPRDRLSPPEQP